MALVVDSCCETLLSLPDADTQTTSEDNTGMAVGNNNHSIGKLEGVIEGLGKEVATLNKMLMGNGQPGIVERTARIEETLENVCEMLGHSKQILFETNKALSSLTDLVKEHHANDEVHSPKMFLKKEHLAAAVLMFVLLHSILPPDLNVFDLIRKFVGL